MGLWKEFKNLQREIKHEREYRERAADAGMSPYAELRRLDEALKTALMVVGFYLLLFTAVIILGVIIYHSFFS